MLSKLICGRSCHFLLRYLIPTIYLLFIRPGGIVTLLSSTNHLVLSRSCNFSFLIRLTGVSCPLFKFFSSCQVLPPFSTGVLSEIFLTPCAILSIVSEAVCCSFHQVSSHLVKFMFNSFHLQSECCPNYIILIPSLSCFNQSGFHIYLSLNFLVLVVSLVYLF